MLGGQEPSARRTPSSKPRAVLTCGKAVDIFRRSLPSAGCLFSAEKLTATFVAQEYGINEKTVRDIWTGRTWYNETLHLDPHRPHREAKTAGRPRGKRDSIPRRKYFGCESKKKDSATMHSEETLYLPDVNIGLASAQYNISHDSTGELYNSIVRHSAQTTGGKTLLEESGINISGAARGDEMIGAQASTSSTSTSTIFCSIASAGCSGQHRHFTEKKAGQNLDQPFSCDCNSAWSAVDPVGATVGNSGESDSQHSLLTSNDYADTGVGPPWAPIVPSAASRPPGARYRRMAPSFLMGQLPRPSKWRRPLSSGGAVATVPKQSAAGIVKPFWEPSTPSACGKEVAGGWDNWSPGSWDGGLDSGSCEGDWEEVHSSGSGCNGSGWEEGSLGGYGGGCDDGGVTMSGLGWSGGIDREGMGALGSCSARAGGVSGCGDCAGYGSAPPPFDPFGPGDCCAMACQPAGDRSGAASRLYAERCSSVPTAPIAGVTGGSGGEGLGEAAGLGVRRCTSMGTEHHFVGAWMWAPPAQVVCGVGGSGRAAADRGHTGTPRGRPSPRPFELSPLPAPRPPPCTLARSGLGTETQENGAATWEYWNHQERLQERRCQLQRGWGPGELPSHQELRYRPQEQETEQPQPQPQPNLYDWQLQLHQELLPRRCRDESTEAGARQQSLQQLQETQPWHCQQQQQQQQQRQQRQQQQQLYSWQQL